MKDVEYLKLQVRRFVARAANFVKPQPVQRPISVEELLGSQSSLELVERFNDLYYKSGTPGELNWRGDSILKNPCDLWMVVELFQKIRPSVVVETGTHRGGSASFYADMLHLFGLRSTVITVDMNPKWSFDPRDKNIVSVVGYSTDTPVVAQVSKAVSKALEAAPGPVMLMLDSAHDRDNVSKEMALYSGFVTLNSYMIVEDTNINGHPSSPNSGPGPWEAVDEFLAARNDFVPDRDCERFMLTFFPRGWLRRVRQAP